MIVRLPRGQAEVVLGAMRQIALAHGAGGASDADRQTIEAAAWIVLGLEGESTDHLAPRTPDELAAAMLGPEDAAQAVRIIAVMALVDGEVDADKIALVEEYARALGVEEAYLRVLAEAAEGEIQAASACMVRKNAESFPMLDRAAVAEDPAAAFMPYREGRERPELAARYEALGGLPTGTFGRAFRDHFKRNRFAFPGDPSGLAEGFTTPHDSSHVLSGYSTSQQGEVLVSTFIGAMHPDHPMAAEVLPVIFSWHLGIKLTELAGSWRGAFEPRRFWTAWDRGAATVVDVLDERWDFWAATEVPLQELRRVHGVAPVAPDLLA